MDRELTLLEGINTLRSVRQFKPDRVSSEDIKTVLEAASKAASGGNTQPWEFIVVQDPRVKARLTKPMLDPWMKHVWSAMDSRMREVNNEAKEMLQNTENVPVIIYCCLDLNRAIKIEEIRYASIYPAVQNLMLAAHALGLGTCLTVHGSTANTGEQEVKEILGVPDYVKICCLVYMGYPRGRHSSPRRKRVSSFIRYDHW